MAEFWLLSNAMQRRHNEHNIRKNCCWTLPVAVHKSQVRRVLLCRFLLHKSRTPWEVTASPGLGKGVGVGQVAGEDAEGEVTCAGRTF